MARTNPQEPSPLFVRKSQSLEQSMNHILIRISSAFVRISLTVLGGRTRHLVFQSTPPAGGAPAILSRCEVRE